MFIKIAKLVLLFGVICSFAITAVQLSYAADAVTQPKVIITGISGEGDVQVLQAGTNSWINAEENMVLHEGDLVLTGADSGASIKYTDGAIVDLVKESRFNVAVLRDANNPNRQQNVLSIESGYMHGLFEKISSTEESKFTVKTPTAVCGVLGTKIYVDADTGTVYVTEGVLSIVNTVTGETVTVSAGNSITINTNGSTTGAQPYSEAAIESVANTFTVMDIDVLGYTAVPTDEGEIIIEFTPVTEQVASKI